VEQRAAAPPTRLLCHAYGVAAAPWLLSRANQPSGADWRPDRDVAHARSRVNTNRRFTRSGRATGRSRTRGFTRRERGVEYRPRLALSERSSDELQRVTFLLGEPANHLVRANRLAASARPVTAPVEPGMVPTKYRSAVEPRLRHMRALGPRLADSARHAQRREHRVRFDHANVAPYTDKPSGKSPDQAALSCSGDAGRTSSLLLARCETDVVHGVGPAFVSGRVREPARAS
jgi:hypothetical protein